MLTVLSYVRGKRKAEEALAEIYGKDGVALRPTVMYGTRRIGSLNVPLGVVGAPWAFTLNYFSGLRKLPLVGDFALPPLNVEVMIRS